jgi:hypothetical protein
VAPAPARVLTLVFVIPVLDAAPVTTPLAVFASWLVIGRDIPGVTE